MTHRRSLFLASALGVCTLAMGVGCHSNERVTAHDVRKDMTPALDSITRTTQQDRNQYARVIDHNTRAIWNDLARFWLIDRTSRLEPWPMP